MLYGAKQEDACEDNGLAALLMAGLLTTGCAVRTLGSGDGRLGMTQVLIRDIRGGPHPLDRFSSQLRWNPVHDSSDLGLTGTGA